MSLYLKILYRVLKIYSRVRFPPTAEVSLLRKRLRRAHVLSEVNLKFRFPKVECHSFEIEGVPAEWLDAYPEESKPILLYLHGGGYFMGGIDTHRGFTLRLSFRGRVRVCSIDYRLAPENPFPAALEDALKSYEWLRQHFPQQNIYVAGDSAGGGLTLALLLSLRDQGKKLPEGAICISAWTDLTGTAASLKTRRHRDCLLPPDGVSLWPTYYAPKEKWSTPYVSPLFGDYRGLSPLLMMVGEEELLLDDTLRVFEKAKAASVPVDLYRAPFMQHNWPLVFPDFKESKMAMDLISKFLQRNS